ncbi:MAG: hypothetical protein US74_C0042G0003 [Parcubacteria group bacterium GW2011_GWA2_38_13]|nr:MAG: hypothetical protein US74_C0042G0003 [Parcubacteria group bacterium GW2011_GWA2_38_13]
MKISYKQHSAFTLIESLVAVSLFVLVVTAALGLFLTYSKAQKETGVRQKVINQLSVEMEKIAKDIRLNKIAFSGTAGYWSGNLYELDGTSESPFMTGKEEDLGFINGQRYFFVPADDTTPISCYGEIDNLESGVLYKYSSSSVCEPLFMISGINLIDVGFYISPNYNPYPAADAECKITDAGTFNGYYCQGSSSNDCYGVYNEGFCYVSQPSVTISITAQTGTDTSNIVTLQTTVSSRVYQ